MRRIALFSDVHANLLALNRVLDDIDAASADETFCVGDLVGYGPEPGRVVARVRSEGIRTVRGNYDRGVGGRLGDCGCYYATDQAKADGDASYRFTVESLSEADLEWLYDLPDEIRVRFGGATVLLTHGSPRRIDEYLMPDRTDEQLARLADQAAADVVCVGHVHVPYHRAVPAERGLVHYVSAGSVGKPKDGDPRAAWVELLLGDADEVRAAAGDDSAVGPVAATGLHAGVRVHRVTYDVAAVGSAMLAVGLPATLVDALHGG